MYLFYLVIIISCVPLRAISIEIWQLVVSTERSLDLNSVPPVFFTYKRLSFLNKYYFLGNDLLDEKKRPPLTKHFRPCLVNVTTKNTSSIFQPFQFIKIKSRCYDLHNMCTEKFQIAINISIQFFEHANAGGHHILSFQMKLVTFKGQ